MWVWKTMPGIRAIALVSHTFMSMAGRILVGG
jgi:hypothetical protein